MAEYRQTHVVPTEGLPAWAGPDGSAAPAANLDPGLDVMLLERRGDWAQVRCSNGWEAWVDARRLVVSAAAPAPAPPPPAAPAPPQTAPTSAVWGASGAVAGAPRAGGGFRIGVGEILALVGSFIVVVSTWFNWVGRDNFHRSAYKMPAHFLLDSTSGDGGLNLGIVVLIIGVMGIAFALMPGPRALRVGDIAVGGVALLIALLFIWQVKELSAHPLVSVSTLGLLDVGPFIAIVGAGLVAVGGVLSLLKKS